MKYINELVIDGKGACRYLNDYFIFEIMNISVMSAELKRENKKGKKKGRYRHHPVPNPNPPVSCCCDLY